MHQKIVLDYFFDDFSRKVWEFGDGFGGFFGKNFFVHENSRREAVLSNSEAHGLEISSRYRLKYQKFAPISFLSRFGPEKKRATANN